MPSGQQGFEDERLVHCPVDHVSDVSSFFKSLEHLSLHPQLSITLAIEQALTYGV